MWSPTRIKRVLRDGAKKMRVCDGGCVCDAGGKGVVEQRNLCVLVYVSVIRACARVACVCKRREPVRLCSAG